MKQNTDNIPGVCSKSVFDYSLVIFLVLFLSACSRPYTKSMEADLQLRPVETNIAHLPQITLNRDEFEFTINDNSPVFKFDFGRSYVALIKLPEYQPGKTLRFKSLCECIGLTKSIYIPLVAVLDEKFEPIKHLLFATQSPTAWDAASYQGETGLTAKDRYLFVYSDKRKYGEIADNVRIPITTTTVDYHKTGGSMYKTTTYHSSETGLWWRGSAVGSFKLFYE